MNEEKIIIEYFANDDQPANITDIKQLKNIGEHYYKVNGEDENGKFETSVFVDNGLVLILPE